MNSAIATIIILLELPALVLTWVVLAFRGTRPLLMRHESLFCRHAGPLRFNVEDDHWTSRRIRGLGLDLCPILFDVVSGRLSLMEGVRLTNQVARERGPTEQPHGFIQILRLVALLILATVILWVAWHPF